MDITPALRPALHRVKHGMRIVYTDRHKLHNTDQVEVEGHPFVTEEVPARAEIILQAVQSAQLGPVTAPTDHGLEPLLAVHDADYVSFLQSVYAQKAAFYEEAAPVFTWTFATRYTGRKPKTFLGLLGYYAFGWGTPILKGTWEAAYWSAQCALSAADWLRVGERAAYALCRPPGHHAAADLYGGFCYLNNAAIAARYLQADSNRVAVLDIDYHHGNGTQAIFYADPAVLYCSLHADPDYDYPFYWGAADECGAGAGEGYNYNWPLPLGTGDASYLAALANAIAVICEFSPDYLVVSAGLDIVAGDEVGGFSVTSAGLQEIGAQIAALNLPTVIVQEGGYLLERLGENAIAFLGPFGDAKGGTG
jgi:acetoin utilization deacetylase AcuC-like enzyme